MSFRAAFERYYREYDPPSGLRITADDGAHSAAVTPEDGGHWGSAYERILEEQMREIATLLGGDLLAPPGTGEGRRPHARRGQRPQP